MLLNRFLFLFCLFLLSHFSRGQVINTIAGTGQPGYNGDSIYAVTARVNLPICVRPDIYGNIYIADRVNHRVRKIEASSGLISTIAGTGIAGFSGDGGSASLAQLNNPSGLAIMDDGTIFVSEISNHRIRRISSSGIITTYAGNGFAGFSGDGGQANSASLNTPWGLALDANNNLYVADRANNRVRKIDFLTGIITTIAGNGASGFAGDGGPATAAVFNKPISLAIHTSGDLLIADEDNHRVRLVTAFGGLVSTIAGTGTAGFNGDGIAANTARLNFPSGVGFDNAGNIYISDRSNQRVRKVNTAGIISTIAGTGSIGFSGDGGNAASAQLNYPRELFSDGSGNIYLADTDNNRIRKITFCNLPDVPTLAASQISICQGETTSLSILSGNLNQATSWEWYAQSCGGLSVGSGSGIFVSPAATTTYYARGEGGCATSYGCASITIAVNPPPSNPSSITGNPEICAGSTQVYAIQPVTGASSYQWLIPGSWSGNSITESISLVPNTFSDSIFVFALNACGISDTVSLSIRVLQIPAQPNLIAGPDSLCAEAEGLFIISSVPDADAYNWLLPQGWSGSSVSDSISVFPGTSSGTISVSASNVCGSSPAQTLQITVTSFDTSISDLGFFISSNDSNSSYQWIDCASNSIIQGATGQDFFPSQNGNYAVVLSQNTCLDTSSCFSYVNTSLLSISNTEQVKCYPIPAHDELFISGTNSLSGSFLLISDALGRDVHQELCSGLNMVISLQKFEPGFYFLRFSESPQVLKFVKN